MCTTLIGSVLALIEHLLVLLNNIVAPVKNPPVAISTTEPGLHPSFLFQSTLLSFFSVDFLPSIKIFLKGICDGQSWIYGVRSVINGIESSINAVESTNNGVESINNAVESTNNAIESTNNGVESTNNGVESTNNAVESTNNGVRSIISGRYVLSRKA